MTVFQDDWNKFHHSGRILLLAPSFLIVPLTRKLKLLLGFKERCYSKGNIQSLQEQQITQSETVKLMYVLYRNVIQETTHCQGEYVCIVFICPMKDSIYMLIRSTKPLWARAVPLLDGSVLCNLLAGSWKRIHGTSPSKRCLSLSARW